MSLAARHLEAAGIPTVIVGSARDIVEECGVPRFLFVDFPLGNPCGKPWDGEMQYKIVGGALDHGPAVGPTWRTRATAVSSACDELQRCVHKPCTSPETSSTANAATSGKGRSTALFLPRVTR